MGLLEPLIQDPNIEDISCSGVGAISSSTKIFKHGAPSWNTITFLALKAPYPSG